MPARRGCPGVTIAWTASLQRRWIACLLQSSAARSMAVPARSLAYADGVTRTWVAFAAALVTTMRKW